MTANWREKALAFLGEGDTCAIVGEKVVLRSKERGVKPLMTWLGAGENCVGAVAADKVVGKAAAYLYVLLGVAEVHAKVLSEMAEEVFVRFGIAYTFAERVGAIRNRTNTGFCPMEQAVLEVDNPKRAYTVLNERINTIKKEETK
ncbi:MAG: DUF1893 domain-containing protein [Clostridiales bacterium]|nr:DUF1893 domain-containing protein [Clostridiales bacterium]